MYRFIGFITNINSFVTNLLNLQKLHKWIVEKGLAAHGHVINKILSMPSQDRRENTSLIEVAYLYVDLIERMNAFMPFIPVKF